MEVPDAPSMTEEAPLESPSSASAGVLASTADEVMLQQTSLQEQEEVPDCMMDGPKIEVEAVAPVIACLSTGGAATAEEIAAAGCDVMQDVSSAPEVDPGDSLVPPITDPSASLCTATGQDLLSAAIPDSSNSLSTVVDEEAQELLDA